MMGYPIERINGKVIICRRCRLYKKYEGQEGIGFLSSVCLGTDFRYHHDFGECNVPHHSHDLCREPEEEENENKESR